MLHPHKHFCVSYMLCVTWISVIRVRPRRVRSIGLTIFSLNKSPFVVFSQDLLRLWCTISSSSHVVSISLLLNLIDGTSHLRWIWTYPLLLWGVVVWFSGMAGCYVSSMAQKTFLTVFGGAMSLFQDGGEAPQICRCVCTSSGLCSCFPDIKVSCLRKGLYVDGGCFWWRMTVPRGGFSLCYSRGVPWPD